MRADNTTVAEFASLLDAWSVAIVANDADAIAAFARPDWVFVGEQGIFEGAQFLEAVAAGHVTHDSMRHDVHRVDVHGDVALVITRTTNTGTLNSSAFASDEWTTDVFVRDPTGWQCALTHLTTARTASEPDYRPTP